MLYYNVVPRETLVSAVVGEALAALGDDESARGGGGGGASAVNDPSRRFVFDDDEDDDDDDDDNGGAAASLPVSEELDLAARTLVVLHRLRSRY
jgi:hypothetical protein